MSFVSFSRRATSSLLLLTLPTSSRAYAVGARQGSSIANVRMVRYGKYDIPARLLKRWLLKHEKNVSPGASSSASQQQKGGGGSAINKKKQSKKSLENREHFSAPFEKVATMSALELSNAIIQQWRTYHAMRPSWMLMLCRAAKTPDDWHLCCDAWRIFQARIEFAEREQYGREFVGAALRAGQLDSLYRVLLDGSTYRVAISGQLMQELLLLTPSRHFELFWRVVVHRSLPQAPSASLLRAALHRCAASSELAPLAESLYKQYIDAGYVDTLAITNCRMIAQVLQGNYDRCREIQRSSGREPSVATKCILISGDLMDNKIDDAKKVLQSITTSEQTYAIDNFALHCRSLPKLIEPIEQLLRNSISEDAVKQLKSKLAEPRSKLDETAQSYIATTTPKAEQSATQ